MPIFGKKLGTKEESGATQQFVDVREIKEGVVILNDNSLRTLVEVSSINFSLKGEEEQNAIIFQFQDFLNSLDFPIQIMITSRKLDIVPYLNFLTQLGGQQTNELLKVQTEEYLNFVKGLTELQNIMTKRFFAVVTLHRVPTSFNPFAQGKKRHEPTPEQAEEYLKSRNQIMQRTDHVLLGLKRLGLKSRLMNSEEILNLLVQLYNPTMEIRELNLPSGGLEGFS